MGFLQLCLRDARRNGTPSQVDHLDLADQALRRMADVINDFAHGSL